MTKLWFAILKDEDDNDWGTGSTDYAEAVEMAKASNCYAICVIADNKDPIAIDVIYAEDFDAYDSDTIGLTYNYHHNGECWVYGEED